MKDQEFKIMTEVVYQARRRRQQHPEGSFDSAGRWYPSDGEDGGDVVRRIRSPSRAWPYSYLVACRTKRHIQRLGYQYLTEQYDQLARRPMILVKCVPESLRTEVEAYNKSPKYRSGKIIVRAGYRPYGPFEIFLDGRAPAFRKSPSSPLVSESCAAG